jgi:L-lactate dehydrogenase
MASRRRRVAIVGTGWVGASVAMSTLITGAVGELLLHDARAGLAEGEAMDLAHGASFYPAAGVRAASLDELVDADVIVVSAGRGGRPDESRLDLLRDNAAIARSLGERLRGCRGMVVVLTNPVDVLTHVLTEASGLPPARVVGTGTMLDTARLRQMVGSRLAIDPRSVHAHVVGEHGDSEVVLWSGARVGGVSLRSWPGWDRGAEDGLARQIRTAAYEIIRRKGATNHAIGLVTADLIRCLLRDERRVLTVSRVQPEGDPWSGVALSMPAVVGADGAASVLLPDMDDEERDALTASARVLRGALDGLAAFDGLAAAAG